MSARFDFFDFLSMLDLGMTPYPNYAIMGNWSGNYDQFFNKLAECEREDAFIFNARQFVLCSFGDVDADLGMRILKEIQSWCFIHYKPKNKVSIADEMIPTFRKLIYSGGYLKKCRGPGESYNNYEPCPINHAKLNLVYKKYDYDNIYKSWTKNLTDTKRQDALEDVRIELMDAKDIGSTAWLYRGIAAAERMQCPASVIISGLRKEF